MSTPKIIIEAISHIGAVGKLSPGRWVPIMFFLRIEPKFVLHPSCIQRNRFLSLSKSHQSGDVFLWFAPVKFPIRINRIKKRPRFNFSIQLGHFLTWQHCVDFISFKFLSNQSVFPLCNNGILSRTTIYGFSPEQFPRR